MKQLFISFLFLLPFSTFAQREITLDQALSQNLISTKFVSNGGAFGQKLKVIITNKSSSPLNITTPSGTQFQSDEQWIQDLVVLKENQLLVNSGKTVRADIFTACTQLQNCSPIVNHTFQLNDQPFVNDTLIYLIEAFEGHQNYTSQSAIWTILGQMEGFFSTEDTLSRRFIPLFKNAGIPVRLSEDGNTHIGYEITFINTSIAFYAEDYVTHATLKAYDQEGKFFRAYDIPSHLEPGFQHFRVGLNHRMGDSAQFVLKLESEGEVLAQKEVFNTDTIPQYDTFHEELETAFELKSTIQHARAGIYDEQDRLCVMLQDDFTANQGLFVSRFQWVKAFPMEDSLTFKLTQGKKVIYERTFNIEDALKKNYKPIVKRGILKVNFSDYVEGAKMAVYDEFGKVIWVVFEDSFLGHGNRQLSYAFKHHYGTEATFFVRLFDKEGIMLAEKIVK